MKIVLNVNPKQLHMQRRIVSKVIDGFKISKKDILKLDGLENFLSELVYVLKKDKPAICVPTNRE